MSLLLSALDPVSLTSLNRELDKMVRHAFTQPVLRSSRTERDAAAAFAPALDLEEPKDAYLVHVELPGVPADQVQVSLEGDLLRISGERGLDPERSPQDELLRQERRFGRFSRTVRLPERTVADKVRASARDGVVTVHIPKAPDAKARQIKVESA